MTHGKVPSAVAQSQHLRKERIPIFSKWLLRAAGATLSKPAGFSLCTEEVLKKCEHGHFICVGSQPRAGQSNLLLPVKEKSTWKNCHIWLTCLTNEIPQWTLCMGFKRAPSKTDHWFDVVWCSAAFLKTAWITKQFMTLLNYSNCNELDK